jgi:putative endonuclease
MDRRTSRRKLGDLGEGIACEFLMKRGFIILERNYLRKWGEIDVVGDKNGVIHFIEVKSVEGSLSSVANGYRPEDNMHPWKLKRLARTMQTYMLEKRLDCDYQLDLITVRIDTRSRVGHVELIENIII